jgi:poly(hydroxyalkanoate) depolymerase family esterase
MRLARLKQFARPFAAHGIRSTRLRSLEGFGSNPGDLGAWYFTPSEGVEPMPLVVVLHGCTQSAHSYDIGSGWSALAEAHGFAVVYPEQQAANNPNGCFNWFDSSDTRRGSGEAYSIAQMVDAMIAHHRVDRARVFITGLSAGGAMTSVLLATYPEKFAGGAIIAGLPYGAAASVQGALQQMRAHKPSSRTTGASVKCAAPHKGPWPAVSVWHGTSDTVVDESNADAIVRQWREVHGLPDNPNVTEVVDGQQRRVWQDPSGRTVLEDYRIAAMGHGVPLATSGADPLGQVGAFMLEAGISSTLHIAKAWGLVEAREARVRAKAKPAKAVPAPTADEIPPPIDAQTQVSKVIEQALRTAGLMR